MLPVLQIGPLAIQTYPLALLLAGFLALSVAGRAAQRLGLDDDHVYNAGLYALIAGVIGARLGHVVAYWEAYRSQPIEIFAFNTQAFVIWPGLIAAAAVGGWYVYRHKLPLARFLDALAPGMLVGLAVAATGALLAGRYPGAAAQLPWSVNVWGVLRHPSQAYEAIGLLLVAALVWSAIKQGAPPGAPALVALLGYGLVRWLLDPFREVSATVLGGLRTGQIAGLAIALIALWALGKIRFGDRAPASPVVSVTGAEHGALGAAPAAVATGAFDGELPLPDAMPAQLEATSPEEAVPASQEPVQGQSAATALGAEAQPAEATPGQTATNPSGAELPSPEAGTAQESVASPGDDEDTALVSERRGEPGIGGE